MRWVSGLAGTVLLVATLMNVLRTLVVPRGLASALYGKLWVAFRATLRMMAHPFRSYEALDRFLAWLAPSLLVGMLAAWLGGIFAAYGLLTHAVSGLPIRASFREAGSSLFTLGFASTDRPQLSVLDFLAAATGPLVIALQISYLPTLYASYNRRETDVTLLQARAGEPAWGPELLARQSLVGTETALPELYRSWERLAADIGESHANYPVLLAFRSPQPYRSWIVALIAVMDAAALHLALNPGNAPPEARLALRAGFTALRDIARVIGVPFDPDPHPDAPIRLTYEEYVAGVARATDAGFKAERDAAAAWPHFAGWRVNYERIAYELARRTDAVPALWTGPRDEVTSPMPPRRPADRRPVER